MCHPASLPRRAHLGRYRAASRAPSAEEAGLTSANHGEHAARQRPYRSPPAAALVQKAPKTALGRAAAPTQAHQAQLRHRRRRRKGGGDVREPQGDDVAQAGRDHEAQEQGAARAADDRAGRDAVRRRHPPGGEMRGSGFPEGPGRLSSARRPARLSTLRRAGRRCGCRASMGGGMSAVRINDSADREPTAAGRFAHEAIAQRMVPGHGFLRHGARRGHADRGHGPKRGVGIDRRRAAKRR